jgi:hypothetical protein
VCISLIMSILLSVHTEEPLNGYAINLILWSYTKNWTTTLDTLCTNLRRFRHISHMWFVSNTLNNYQCKNYLKNKLQRQIKNISHSIYFFAALTLFKITTFSDKTSVNISEVLLVCSFYNFCEVVIM